LGIDLNRAAIQQDKDETVVRYGKFVPFALVLFGEVPPPTDGKTFWSTLRKYADVAEQNQSGESWARKTFSPEPGSAVAVTSGGGSFLIRGGLVPPIPLASS
jgi:hypothetical protein